MHRGGVLALALWLPGSAWATDRAVPGTYMTIQAAITASALSGDRVLVGAGTYAENLTTGTRSIEIIGAGTSLVTLTPAASASTDVIYTAGGTVRITDLTIDAQSRTRGMWTNGGTLTLDHVDIRNGRSTNAGAFAVTNATVSISNGTFSAGSATYGGAIYASPGTVALTNMTLASNTATTLGGAIYQNGGSLTVTNSTVRDNAISTDGADGAGIYIQSGPLVVDGSTFTNNDSARGGGADNIGGAIYATGNTVTVRTSTFTGNDTEYGGGVFANFPTTVVLSDNWFESGTASRGPGVYIWGGTGHTLARNVFCENTVPSPYTGALNGDGGGIFLRAAPAKVVNNVFFGNVANDQGGAIWLSEGIGTTQISNNDFIANDAVTSGSAIHTDISSGSLSAYNNLFAYNTTRPAFHRTGAAGTFSVTDSWFWQNLAGDASFVLAGSNTTGTDPLLANYTPSDCTVANLYPRVDSGLIDKGLISLLDVDGTRSDIGAFGGPDADKAPWLDADGDGAVVMWDCDDKDPARSPFKTEVCDPSDVDEDCDGAADDLDSSTTGKITVYTDTDKDGHGAGVGLSGCISPTRSGFGDDCDDGDPSWYAAKTWYKDADADGHGDATESTTACTAPVGYVALSDDCDDLDKTAAVLFSVYADNDTDTWGGLTTKIACRVTPGWVARTGDCDDGDSALNPDTSWYIDGDKDGVGGSSTVTGCPQPADTSTKTGDCDDANAAIGATVPWYTDGDGDGYGGGSLNGGCPPGTGWSSKGADCNDADASLNPTTKWYGDGDGDGYGVSTDLVVTCAPGTGYARAAGDCDNGDAAVNPAASEVCNLVDDDCDVLVDDADASVNVSTGKFFYPDADADKHGADDVPGKLACAAGVGMAGTADDCDDTVPFVYTGAPEQCNSIDDDCDGVPDDNVTSVDWYPDGDGDGFGSGTPTNTCALPGAGYALAKGDCDESDPSINPGAVETCDGVDQDCDKQVDDAASDADTWYTDDDADGFGDPAMPVVACEQPSSVVADGTDCDDTLFEVHPNADELCNDDDDDCNGTVDDGALDAAEWYQDVDGDGFGDGTATLACEPPDASWVDVDGDCDDGAELVYPGATEQCNDADDDCDGKIDEDPIFQDWYADADEDGYGDADDSVNDCKQPDGFVIEGTDCDDGDPTAHPDAVEIDGNGVDEDCDGHDGGDVGRPFVDDTDLEDSGLVPVIGEACGCRAASPSGSAASLWGLGLALAIRASRRRPASP